MNKILLVDDDPLTLKLLSSTLQRQGFQVTEACSGQEALDCVAALEPDLALLDVNMPGMSGLELARRLKQDNGVAFMFLSAVADSDIVKTAVEHGAVGYLVKPIDIAKLLPTLQAGLARAEEIKQLRKAELGLSSALASGRETSMAVGVLMARFQADRHTAFEVLRGHARSQRKTLHEVAEAVLQAEEALNLFKPLFLGKPANHKEK